MRYLETENPYIWAKFNAGDSATITIYDASDNSVVVSAAAMSELGTTGYFKYLFNPAPAALTYYFYVVSTANEEHAGTIVLGGYPNTVLADTNELQTNQGNWLTASGFATENPPSQNLDDYKANVSAVASEANATLNSDKIIVKGEWISLQSRINIDNVKNASQMLIFSIKNLNGSQILASEITDPGNVSIGRVRNGSAVNIIDIGFTASNGMVFIMYDFPDTVWQADDIMTIAAQFIEVTRNGRTVNVANADIRFIAITENSLKPETDSILSEVSGLNGDTMRGTDGANTIAPDNAGIAAIPVNPVLIDDARLDNLDALVSSRSSHSAADVWNENQAKYMLGLMQHNFRLRDQVYSDNKLTSATLRIYNNAADTDNDLNHIKEYHITAAYDAEGDCSSYKVTEV